METTACDKHGSAIGLEDKLVVQRSLEFWICTIMIERELKHRLAQAVETIFMSLGGAGGRNQDCGTCISRSRAKSPADNHSQSLLPHAPPRELGLRQAGSG